ncbi:hypothetical protein T09_4265, partial [Trichinella sp. T9]
AELFTFFRLSQEIRNWEPPRYVCCTLLIVSDRLMPINSIFGGIRFSGNLQNFMVSMASWTWFFLRKSAKTHFWHLIWVCIKIQQQRLLPDRVLTLRDFHHLPSRLNQPRAKLYCSEISKKLFPNYHDRRTTIRTCSNMCIHFECSLMFDKRWRCVTKVQVQDAIFRVAYPTYVSRCLTLRAQCLAFMQIRPLEY